MFVRNFMSTPPIVVEPTTSARGALDLMVDRKIRRLPVVEGDRLVGILTKSDIERQRWKGKAVGDLMTRDPLTVEPDETLEKAAHLMLERKISGLPVVAGAIVGIITESDLFRALCAMLGIGEPSARIVMTVPEGGNLLEAISSRAEGLDLRSVATYRNLFENRWEVMLRVRSSEK